MVFFARYLLSAGAATCADIALVQALLSFDLLHQAHLFPLVMLAGASLGLSINFALSRRFVFAAEAGPARAQFVRFLLVSLTTFGLRLGVAYALLALFALPFMSWIGLLPLHASSERLAHLGAVALVTLYSFVAHKHISFGSGGFPAFAKSKMAVP